jgi:hypothetical protein
MPRIATSWSRARRPAFSSRKAASINKAGRALQDPDPVCARFSRLPELAALVGELGVAAPLLLQSDHLSYRHRIACRPPSWPSQA